MSTMPLTLKAIYLPCVDCAATVYPVLMSMCYTCSSNMVYMLPDIIV